LLAQHHKLHMQLAEQSKSLLATSLQTQMAAQQAQGAMQQAEQMKQGNQKSPTGAGGRESGMRDLGAMMSGNG